MRSDFEPIVHRLPPAPEVKIYFIADLHVGSIESNVHEWERFADSVLKDKNAYLAILGDMMDNGTKQSVTNCFHACLHPREQKKYLMGALKPLASRILCIVQGNHEARGRDVDDYPLYDVACKLDIEDYYRQNAAFVNLRIGTRPKGEIEATVNSYVMCCMHGSGGGGLTGSSVNKNERFSYVLEGVDLLATAHVHLGVITKPSRLVYDRINDKITQRSMTVVSACSWLSYGGYALNKMLLPAQQQDPEQPQVVLLGGLRRHRYVKTVW